MAWPGPYLLTHFQLSTVFYSPLSQTIPRARDPARHANMTLENEDSTLRVKN